MRRWPPATPAFMLALILAFLLVWAGMATTRSRSIDVRSDPAAFDPAACTVSIAAAPCHPVASRSPFLFGYICALFVMEFMRSLKLDFLKVT